MMIREWLSKKIFRLAYWVQPRRKDSYELFMFDSFQEKIKEITKKISETKFFPEEIVK